MKLRPIGIIRSPFKVKQKTPIQPFKSKAAGRVEVYKKFAAGLRDVTGFSHIIIIYQFHKSRGYKLLVTPFLDRQTRGLFATRYPRRPNQIGISVVRLLKRRGNILFVKGIDVLDGTPLLDIKPYVPDFAVTTKVEIGWLKNKNLQKRKKL
jgi:tRNA-Thr(GGU) m(6)t(6)A37 methyltransferase TsaA